MFAAGTPRSPALCRGAALALPLLLASGFMATARAGWPRPVRIAVTVRDVATPAAPPLASAGCVVRGALPCDIAITLDDAPAIALRIVTRETPRGIRVTVLGLVGARPIADVVVPAGGWLELPIGRDVVVWLSPTYASP